MKTNPSIIELSFATQNYSVRFLSQDSKNDVDDLYFFWSKDVDFFREMSGVELSRDFVNAHFYDLPPGKTKEDKFTIIVFNKEGAALATCDWIDNYIKHDECNIGHLIIHPANREHGAGSKIYHLLEKALISCGCKGIVLLVQEQNPRAFRFWQANGYQAIKSRKQSWCDKEETIMRKTCSSRK